MTQLINAAANYWKHSADWSDDVPDKRAEELRKQTLKVIQSLGVDTNRPYPLTNTMYEIINQRPARFVNLLPLLMEWRDGIVK